MALSGVDPKDPSESEIYTMSWTSKLTSGTTVSTSAWVLKPSGLTNVADGIVVGGLSTTIQLSGGNPGSEYECENTVVTSNGETLVLTGLLKVAER